MITSKYVYKMTTQGAATPPVLKQGRLRVLLFLIPWVTTIYIFDLVSNWIIKQLLGDVKFSIGGNIPSLIKFAVGGVGATLVVWIYRVGIDKQSFKSLGFALRPFTSDAGIGFFAAPAILGIGSLLLVLSGYIQFTSLNTDIADLLLEAVLMMIISFSEEVVIRGYMLHNLMESLNRWVALTITAVFFAAMHLANPDVSFLSFINILAAGFLLGINYIYTKNLWFGLCFHFTWNFFQGPVYGYKVSGIPFSGFFQQFSTGPALWTGGQFGFEGSLLCLILANIAVLLLARFFSKKYATG